MNRLIIYRDLLEDDVIKQVQNFLNYFKQHREDNYELQEKYSYIASKLLQFGVRKNIVSSLWEEYVYNLILQDENIFSLSCEKEKNINTLNKNIIIALKRDLTIIKEYLNIDWENIAYKIGLEPLPFLDSSGEDITIDEMIDKLATHYYKNGCGIMGRYKAFRWENGLKGIENPDPITLKELIGYEEQKKILIENTESFLKGKKANNVLLFGDRGTGKSSSVKALLNEYSHKGLRLIELAKHQLVDFNKVINLVKNRSQYFIIFMDDLSFEEFEIEYKYMKAVVEGGIEKKPDNVLIYATSNRRHLIKETWKDRQEGQGEVHISDSVQEKISLADRFGISITFTSPNQEEYLKIVEELAKNNNLNISREELRKKALQWEMYHNGRSGRSAKQFIDYMLGK